MTGFCSGWTTVERSGFGTQRVPELVLAHSLSSHSVYDGPGCAIVVVTDPDDLTRLRSLGYAEMAVPEPPPAEPESDECRHRGDVAGLVHCVTCEGNVRLKIYRCALYDLCTLTDRGVLGDDGLPLKICQGCQSRL